MDLMQALSAERVRILRAVRPKPIPVSRLASELQRDRQAVMRGKRRIRGTDARKSLRRWPPDINWWRNI
jgi:hypothetical protein